MLLRHILLFALALAVAAPAALVVDPPIAWAKSRAEAERQRLTDDMERLATRNHWKGVVRKYDDLLELDVPLSISVHMLGYQGARNVGDITLAADSLERAVAAEHTEVEAEVHAAAESALASIYASYSRVVVHVGSKRLPVLIRPEMPFAADQRTAIERAQEQLAQEHTYEGLLPVGQYMVDGVFFDVVSGAEVLEVHVR